MWHWSGGREILKKTLCVTVLCTIIMCTKVRAVSMGWSTLSGFDLSWFCGFGFSSWNFSNMAATHGSRWGSGLGCLAASSHCQWSPSVLTETFLVFSCEIRSWKLCFRQLRLHRVYTAWTVRFVHSCTLNEGPTFGAKIFAHFWAIAIFVLGHFVMPRPVISLQKLTLVSFYICFRSTKTELWMSS